MGGRVTTLYRPVGPAELALIADSEFATFPPRLPEQPIFYPVTNEAYAMQIAKEWNTRHGSNCGYVTKFAVRTEYLSQFDRKVVGARVHDEYWIPAGRLEEFNSNIVGKIEVIAKFEKTDA